MSDFLERFERQLLASKPPKRRHRRRSAAAIAAGLILLSGPAWAATRLWQPKVGDEQRGTPRTSVDPPPAEQLAGMEVLRRTQTSTDRTGVAVQALKLTDTNVDGVRTRWVRVLSTNGIDAALVPVQKYNLKLAEHIEPGMSPEMKRDLSVKRNGLCLFVADPAGDGGGYGCAQWDDIAAGTLPSSIGPMVYGLVPDGVAHVEIRFEDHPPQRLAVHENFYATRSSGDERLPDLAGAVWLDQRGAVVKTITPPTPLPQPAPKSGRKDR
jgi:hypothetical protein